MALESDLILDRARLKRRLTIWRIVAVLAIVAAVFVVTFHQGGRMTASFSPHIERTRITGLIGDGTTTIRALDRLGADASVSAVLLHLDTPGGEVAGGEGIHDAVLRLAAHKPVVAVMDGTAASAGYMIAVAAPHIVARESTITGSIGVIMETMNFGGLLDKIGISVDPLVSGPLKGQPSFDKPLSPEGRQVLQAMVGDLYDQFVDIVAAGRHMDPARVRTLADGRAYTGRQAHALGLVDEIGGDREAQLWLEHTHRIPSGLSIIEPDRRPWTARLTAGTTDSLVQIITEAASQIGLSAAQGLRIDGALALWQPSSQRD
jgi:protease-4